MFGTGLIVFRETLEAALFVGIVAASTRGVATRSRWLAAGVAAGLLGSFALASVMDRVASLAEGLGQDIVTAAILSVALAMLAWHCIWVSTHAREMAAGAKRLGASAAQGTSTLWALSVAVALSVLREGAETVLFVTGLVSGAPQSPIGTAVGVGAGLALGAVAGWVLYAGLARVRAHRLFSVTNALILLLAGSLASQLARTLNQANLLTLLPEPAWDVSSVLPDDSSVGMVLHGVVGYEASPSWLQLMFYVVATGSIWFAARRMQARAGQSTGRAR